jgi:hypothetical protein
MDLLAKQEEKVMVPLPSSDSGLPNSVYSKE